MARIRTIKPEFPQSESMGRVSRDARLLFVNLWTICDDHGRARGAARVLASLLFPYDDDAPALIGGWLAELEREGCLSFYDVGGSRYVQVTNWSSHQKIDRVGGAKCPGPREDASSPREDGRDTREPSRGCIEPSRDTREPSCGDPDPDPDPDKERIPSALPPSYSGGAKPVPTAATDRPKPPATDEPLQALLASWNAATGQRLVWSAKYFQPTEQAHRLGAVPATLGKAARAYVASLDGCAPSFTRFAADFDRWISVADSPPPKREAKAKRDDPRLGSPSPAARNVWATPESVLAARGGSADEF